MGDLLEGILMSWQKMVAISLVMGFLWSWEARAQWAMRPLLEKLQDGTRIGLSRLVAELRGAPFVFVGESHDEPAHHEFQLTLIRNLADSGVPLVIGMEMFQRKSQETLGRWSRGEASEAEIEETFRRDWSQTSWVLYRDILYFARDRGIPIVALRPEDALQGQDHPDQGKGGLPCDVREDYKEFLRWAYHAHDQKERGFEAFCGVQVFWDQSMAEALVAAREEHQGRTFVVLTGLAHAWRPGVPYRLSQKMELLSRIILPEVQGKIKEGPLTIDDADYLWLRY